MKKHKNLIFYVITIGVFSLLIYLILVLGRENLEVSRMLNIKANESSSWDTFLQTLHESFASPVATLLMQIVIILLAVRLFGWICSKIGQPTVIGEIVAGVVLGPSLLGTFLPHISQIIFPETSLGNIGILSQIGLILFMFIVGMELDIKVLKNKANDAVLISHASIIFPFALGIILSYFIYDHFTHQNVHFISFALFMGIAMSITAFPVLARIVHERGINKTPLGALVITCAAIDDITAWCILAAVIAIAKAGSFVSSVYVIMFALIYIIIMFKLIRPFLKRVADLQTSKNLIGKSVIAVFFLVLFLSAYTTEIIGIHALFGAFLAGVIMPSNLNFRKLFIDKIEDISLVLLLPLFFVYTGLRTQIGLLNEPYLWVVCLCIIIVAITGKFVGSAFAARFVGLDWHSSATIGALMNTRGLMELVVLNIGYDLGILTPEVFAMMVVMALVTTFMTSPLLNLTDKIFKRKPQISEIVVKKKFKILVSFDDTVIAKKLLLLANAFVKKNQLHSEVDMVHISPGNNLYQYNMDEEERDVFEPIMEESKKLVQPVTPIFKIASDPFAQVIKMGNGEEYSFILLGAQDSMYKGNLLGQFLGLSNKILHYPLHLLSLVTRGRKATRTRNAALDEGTRTVLTESDIPVGIFVDKGLTAIKNVFVPIMYEEDEFIGEFMERMATNSYVRITLWDGIGLLDKSIEFTKSIRSIKAINPYLFQLWNNNIPIDSDILKKQDLVMVSLNSWKALREANVSWLKSTPSRLMLNE
ncbi:MAG: cation:proton antiporter [Dysgonomonas sp.]